MSPSTPSSIANLSHERAQLRITGADRSSFLQGQCTQDIRPLQPGQSCYAAFLNAKGKMRGEGHIICLDDAFLVEVNVGLAPSLEKFIVTEDVVIEDVSASWGAWLVIGSLPPLPANAITFPHALGTGVISATALTATLSAEDLEVLRIEAAVPLWGADLDEDTIPVEAGLEKRAINYDKGCYIGQETIARIKTYGHVNRRLVQLTLDGAAPPARGAKIFSDDKEVGHVTSAARSFRLGKPVALGYVRRAVAQVTAKFRIDGQSAEVLKICGE